MRIRTWGGVVLLIAAMLSGSEPSPVWAQAGKTQAFFEGFDLLKAGKTKEAADKFEEGLKTDPRNALAHFYLGEAYLGLSQDNKARTHYQQSLELDPNSTVAQDARSRLSNLAPKTVSAEKEESPPTPEKKKPTVEELEAFITDRINASPIEYFGHLHPTAEDVFRDPTNVCDQIDRFTQVNVSFPDRCTITKTVTGERTSLLSNKLKRDGTWSCLKENLLKSTGILKATHVMHLRSANPVLVKRDIQQRMGDYLQTNGIDIGCSGYTDCVKMDHHPNFAGHSSISYKNEFFFVTKNVRDEDDIFRAMRMIVEECADTGVKNPLK